MATEAQCVAAVHLRHNSTTVSADYVLSKASRKASEMGWDRCKAEIKKAREKDASK